MLLKRIKTRIALSFSLLFLIVAIPAIIYAFHQGKIFFEGMYLRQMKVAALSVRNISGGATPLDPDSLTARISRITSSSAFLLSPDRQVISRAYESPGADTARLLSVPIPLSEAKTDVDLISHRFLRVHSQRYLQVQADLPGGRVLLQVKSFGRASMLLARIREVIFWSSFLGLIALVAVAFWVSAKITKPLEELTEQARKILDGRHPEKTSITSPDEVGDLADTLNDIVDNLNMARQRLGKLETMRREFFAKVRGGMESPLDAILKQVDDLRQSPAGGDALSRERLDAIARQASGLKRIIRALIEISEIEFGEAAVEQYSFSIGEMIGETAGLFESRIAEKGLRFDVNYEKNSEYALVMGDRRLLKVVLENLLSNAVDFTDSGFIEIDCRSEGAGVMVAVSDSGHGIASENLDRVFERFFSNKGPRLLDTEGPGLGLAVAMHIIAAHGQKLEVESTLGTGSRFSFWLPLAPQTPAESEK